MTSNLLQDVGLWIDYAFLLMLGGIPWQCYYQRVLSSKTSKRAVLLSYGGGLIALIMTIPSVSLIHHTLSWGHQVQKVDTEAKFYVILFVMINALIWCNFEKNQLGSFWDNPIYPIGYPHGQDLGFFLKGQKMQFL